MPILPKDTRISRAWGPGSKFIIDETAEVLRPSGRFPAVRLDEVAGCLKSRGKAKTLAQMRAGIAREVIRRRDRSR
jgi:hypothetical protein